MIEFTEKDFAVLITITLICAICWVVDKLFMYTKIAFIEIKALFRRLIK